MLVERPVSAIPEIHFNFDLCPAGYSVLQVEISLLYKMICVFICSSTCITVIF